MSKTKQKRMAAYLLLLSLCGGSVGAATQPGSPLTPNNVGAYIYVDGSSTNTTFNVGTVSGWQGTNQGAIVNYYSGKNVTLNSQGDLQSYVGNSAGGDTAGAIYNGSLEQAISITINGKAEFKDNSANRGGAIYNEGTMIFNNGNVTFENNKGTDSSLGNWSGGGAIVNIDGKLGFNSGKVVFKGNTANGNGGAILAGDTGLHKDFPASVDFNTETEFNDNSSTNVGGAIANFDSTLNVNGANAKISFDRNSSGTHGGALYNDGTANLGENASFTNNVAQGNGGAIFNSGTVNIDSAYFGKLTDLGDGTFVTENGNSAVAQGGAIFNSNGNILVSDEIVFADNDAQQGGAISNIDGSVNMKGASATFVGNSAVNAGAISNVSTAGNKANLILGDNVLFQNNSATAYAGAILNQNSNLTIGKNAKFIGNSNGDLNGGNSGGAIAIDSNVANDSQSSVVIGQGALFDGNTSTKSGGAVYVYESGSPYGISLEIGDGAFFETDVSEFPTINSINTIPNYAFVGTNITSVDLPDTVTEIGYAAFLGCAELSEISIPDTILRVKRLAFDDTAWYNSQTYGAAYIDSVLYKYFTNEYEPQSILTVKDGTRVIADYSVSDPHLTEVILPDSVITIGKGAFSGSHNLKKINLPDSLRYIYGSAFSGTAIEEIEIPASVEYIDTWAFSGCNYLTEINVSPDNQYYSSQDGILYNKDKTELLYCPEGKAGVIRIPDGVTKISEYAFRREYYSVNKINIIIIPSSVTEIEYIPSGTFIQCTKGSAAEEFAKQYNMDYYAQSISEIPGDINGDGSVDVKDFVKLKKMSASGDYSHSADLLPDGKINSLDLAEMHKYLLGVNTYS